MVAAAYDFSGMHQVIDVGGGDGRLLTGILRAYPSLQGTVFDLPRLGESARRQITGAGLADRYRFVAGDFFEAVPEGFDAYLLKHVIHDWDDARAVRLLENCRRAMSTQAKLLIVEGVYPPHIDGSPASRGAAANDVNMLGVQRRPPASRGGVSGAVRRGWIPPDADHPDTGRMVRHRRGEGLTHAV
jgi:orsellinic acid C2-O-methyltransferase